jgi:glycosyltransferase involved in cell wall biosynthesis
MTPQPPTLVSLTNIPTPYRTHLYNTLSREMQERGLGLRVLYMAESEPGRHWTFDKENSRYSYTFLKDWTLKYKRYELPFNPGFLPWMWKNPPRWLLVSGSWYFPSVQMVPLATRNAETTTLFWNESNLAYMEQKSGLINAWRRHTLDGYDAYVVPGAWARDYALAYAPSSKQKPFLKLPNVVNEVLFRDKTAELGKQRSQLRQKWGCDTPDKTVLLTVARIEPIKGVRELISALLNFKDIEKVILLIAGSGALKDKLEAQVKQAGRQENIRFIGYQAEAQVLELFALADAFILPSLGDPYPLVVIEASFARLPLLLSDRVGCHPEALKPGENGLLFDPYNEASIQATLQSFLDAGPAQWAEMGRQSLQTAEATFSTRQVVPHFVEELQKL